MPTNVLRPRSEADLFRPGSIGKLTLPVELVLMGRDAPPLLDDYDLFLRVHVDQRSGTISWPNGTDLSPRMLYSRSQAAVPA